MSYPKDIYNKAVSQLALNRQNALSISEKRTTELFNTVPTLKKIIDTQNNLGLNISRAVLNDPINTENIIKTFKHQSDELIREKEQILFNLNLSLDYMNPPFNCPNCEDTGYIDGKKCNCLKMLLKKLTYERLNSLSNLKLSDFHNFDLSYYPTTIDTKTGKVQQEKMREVFEYCIKYANEFSKNSRNVIMIGATGLGKTHLSLAIAKVVIDKGYDVIYASSPNIISTIEQEKFGKISVEESKDTLGTLLDCDLLILDDLGTEFQTQFTSSTVYNIINTRIIKGIPTIINTNLEYKDLENVYSPRILSRLNGNYDTLLFLGNDIRPKLKK